MDRSDRDYGDRDCRHACMAEALSPVPVPVASFARIFVATEETAAVVRTHLRAPLTVNQAMFPEGCR